MRPKFTGLLFSAILIGSGIAVCQGVNADPPPQESYFVAQFGVGLDDIYWGEFHAHSTYSSDSVSASQASTVYNAAEAYDYARYEQGLDFVALSDHAEMVDRTRMPFRHRIKGMSMWESLQATGLEHNDEVDDGDGVFIIFPGYEYTNTHGAKWLMGSCEGYGHKNVFFKNLETLDSPCRYGAMRLNLGLPPLPIPCFANTAYDLYDALDDLRPSVAGTPGDVMIIVHTPANTGDAEDIDEGGGSLDHRTDWDALDPDFVRHIEIFSKWGNSEGPIPVGLDGVCDEDEVYGYEPDIPNVAKLATTRTVLCDRWVVQGDPQFVLSFLGGTDVHSGKPGYYDDNGLMAFEGAVTGVVSAELSRDGLWSALWDRHTLACTTSRNQNRIAMLLGVETASGHLMMGDLGAHTGVVTVHGVADPDVHQIDIIVDGCLYMSIAGNEVQETLTLDPGRHFIYLRANWTDNGVEDKEGRVWSSPVYLY